MALTPKIVEIRKIPIFYFSALLKLISRKIQKNRKCCKYPSCKLGPAFKIDQFWHKKNRFFFAKLNQAERYYNYKIDLHEL